MEFKRWLKLEMFGPKLTHPRKLKWALFCFTRTVGLIWPTNVLSVAQGEGKGKEMSWLRCCKALGQLSCLGGAGVLSPLCLTPHHTLLPGIFHSLYFSHYLLWPHHTPDICDPLFLNFCFSTPKLLMRTSLLFSDKQRKLTHLDDAVSFSDAPILGRDAVRVDLKHTADISAPSG